VVIEIRYIVLKRVFETIVTNGGPVTFNGKMTANLGSAADTLRLAVDGMVTFKKPAVLDGQNGRNTAAMKADNLNGLPKLKHFRVNELS
jgi:hypothetical protein